MNKTPNTNPTPADIATLRAAAATRGDGMTVALCDLATGEVGETGYWFAEDPDDGYRSCLGEVTRGTTDDLPPGSFVEFPPIVLELRIRTKPTDSYSTRDDVLYGVDERTDRVVFEVGTENEPSDGTPTKIATIRVVRNPGQGYVVPEVPERPTFDAHADAIMWARCNSWRGRWTRRCGGAARRCCEAACVRRREVVPGRDLSVRVPEQPGRDT